MQNLIIFSVLFKKATTLLQYSGTSKILVQIKQQVKKMRHETKSDSVSNPKIQKVKEVFVGVGVREAGNAIDYGE